MFPLLTRSIPTRSIVYRNATQRVQRSNIYSKPAKDSIGPMVGTTDCIWVHLAKLNHVAC
uniref:Uncharacterized protein n=1 Tax=Gadus morhua TaxID=8049 RepID=A0A8C5A948_GADMO